MLATETFRFLSSLCYHIGTDLDCDYHIGQSQHISLPATGEFLAHVVSDQVPGHLGGGGGHRRW
jgi:hypothetical protein